VVGRTGSLRAVPALMLAVALSLLPIATAPAEGAAGATAAGAGRTAAGSTAAAVRSASAAEPGGLVAKMTTALTATAGTSHYLGAALSGIVVDLADGTVVWRSNDTRARMPASVQKLLTAYTVLRSLTPARTLDTSICRDRQTPSAVYVRGGGDPTLTTARLQTLAEQTAAALTSAGQTEISLYLDGSLFPAPTAATGWQASYLRSDVQYVRGLTLAGYRGKDGGAAVGTALVADLKNLGVTATVGGAALTPQACDGLATTSSAPVSQLVADMLATSDNDDAEFLLRHAALARGWIPSWGGALANERRRLAEAGVPMRGLAVSDGSGLSRADRTPVATLAAVLRLLHNNPGDAAIVFGPGGLPVAGQSGTLIHRFSTPYQVCAQGHVQAKTGTLADAVSLAGVAQGVDGRDRVFAFTESGLRTNTAVRSALDTLATEVVGCNLR